MSKVGEKDIEWAVNTLIDFARKEAELHGGTSLEMEEFSTASRLAEEAVMALVGAADLVRPCACEE